jgi:L-lactate utilization protein LutC
LARGSAALFVTGRRLLGADPRTEQVEQLKQWALERPNRRLRDAVYQDLAAAAAKQDEQAVAQAAKRFLDAPMLNGTDPRRRQVEEVARQAQEWPNRRLRDRAHEHLVAAREKGDDLGVLRSAEQFLAAPPLQGTDPRTDQVRGLKQWALEAPNRRLRDAAYQDLAAAAAKQDEQAVAQAAKRFLDAPMLNGTDPRRRQVEEVARQAQEWPNRRLRDRAHEHLVAAREKGDDLGVLRSAEQFLAAGPLEGADPRTKQVVAWYNDTFTRWFIGQPDNLNEEAKARIMRYPTLVPAAKP